MEIDNLENVVDDLYAEIQPLYVQLHAFVRGRLAAIDKSGTVHPNRPLPAHILGDKDNRKRFCNFIVATKF